MRSYKEQLQQGSRLADFSDYEDVIRLEAARFQDVGILHLMELHISRGSEI